MRRNAMGTRIVFIILAALLALPIAQAAQLVEAKKRPRTITRTFSNTTSIDLPESETDPVSGSLYPSPISVRGPKGRIRDVNLTLNALTHDFPSDVEVLLVGPRGQTAIVMAHAGKSYDVNDVTLRLDDEADEPLVYDAMLQSGSFRPTYLKITPDEQIVFNAPAPSAGENTALSVFDGTNPNGMWRLFVQDLERTDPGFIAGGWTLEITTKVKAKKKRR